MSIQEANVAYKAAQAAFLAADEAREAADKRMGSAEQQLLMGTIRTLADAAVKAEHLARLAKSDPAMIVAEAVESLADSLAIFANMPRGARLEIPLNS